MKQKAVTCALFIAISSILGSVGLITAGCKTKEQIQVIQPQVVITNDISSASFNDEHYVWEGFIFSTNQVKSANQK